jgi:hypothetical protein
VTAAVTLSQVATALPGGAWRSPDLSPAVTRCRPRTVERHGMGAIRRDPCSSWRESAIAQERTRTMR